MKKTIENVPFRKSKNFKRWHNTLERRIAKGLKGDDNISFYKRSDSDFDVQKTKKLNYSEREKNPFCCVFIAECLKEKNWEAWNDYKFR